MKTSSASGKSAKRTPFGNELLDAALAYAALRWPILPLHWPERGICSCGRRDCESTGKHPLTANGVYDATTDEAQIKNWWKKWPNANIGIATGSESHLVVVDVDGPAGLLSLRQMLGTTEIQLPDTPTVITGRLNERGRPCGIHLYFRHPRHLQLGNSTGRVGKGIDLKGGNGYVVAPPSLHASGRRYVWRKKNYQIPSEAPAWLITSITGQSSTTVSFDQAFHEGERNIRLFHIATKQRRSGATEEEILNRLLRVNNRQCLPPLENFELKRIAANAVRTPVGPNPLEQAWAEIRNDLSGSDYEDFLKLAEQLQRSRQEEEWILLPVKSVGRLMNIDPATVCRLRKRAVKDEKLKLVEEYVPRISAAKYRFNLSNK